MALDKATVRSIATLARIRIPDEDLDGLAGELSNILDWIEQLNEVDTEGVAPMTSVADMETPMRADEVTGGAGQDQILANAPDPQGPYFTVPKVVE